MAWIQRGFDIDGEAVADFAGASVALSADGSVVAIGAYNNDGAGSNAGQVRIYVWNGSSWSKRGNDIDGEAAGDESGVSVALSADGLIVAIGATLNDGNGSNSGQVRVYVWNGSSWVQRGTDINGEAADDQSGYDVALSADGSVVAIGAPFNNGNGSDSGHVRVYVWNGSSWVQRGTDINGEAAGDRSGYSVALSADGSVVAIGADLNDGAGLNAGHVRVYVWNGSSWIQRGTDIDGEATADQFGWEVALSADGSIVAIGAIGNDGAGSNAGHVRVYVWNGVLLSWEQRGADIDGEAAGNQSGWSVALSADGSIVAIGAINNDGTGSDAGHVRVYVWNGSSWIQRGTDINGEAAGNNSGWNIALSSDGSIVAIGAPFNSSRGHVRVYTYANPPGVPTIGTAKPGNAQTTVTFTAPVSDGGAPITSYTVTSSPGGFTGTGASSPITVTGLTNGTVYTFTVTATNGAGTGPASSPSSSIVPYITNVAPCFFGSARVLTPAGYRRLDSVTAGDTVLTPAGDRAAITYVRTYTIDAGPATNPYVIPVGMFGAKRRLLISPDHKVCLADGRRVAARNLGLAQEDREGVLRYYNLELEGDADMVIEGVAVESLAHTRRVRITLRELNEMLRETYGTITPAVLDRVRRTCRFLADGHVEVPVAPKPHISASPTVAHGR
jgi:hypothetical protein